MEFSRNYRGGDAVASLGALNRTPRKAVVCLAGWKAQVVRCPPRRRPPADDGETTNSTAPHGPPTEATVVARQWRARP